MFQLSRKNCWCLEVVILIAIFSISVNAENENIVFSYPSAANYGETFSVDLKLINFSIDSYDVKIDLLNSSNSRIAKILNNGEWKSTYYYINQAINNSITNQSLFSLNITSIYNGAAIINITLKSGKSWKFGPYNLDVVYNSKTDDREDITQATAAEQDTAQDTETETRQDTEIGSIGIAENPENLTINNEIVKSNYNEEIIELNKKDIKSPDNWKSNIQYIKEYSMFGFALVCILIIVVLVIKRK